MDGIGEWEREEISPKAELTQKCLSYPPNVTRAGVGKSVLVRYAVALPLKDGPSHSCVAATAAASAGRWLKVESAGPVLHYVSERLRLAKIP